MAGALGERRASEPLRCDAAPRGGGARLRGDRGGTAGGRGRQGAGAVVETSAPGGQGRLGPGAPGGGSALGADLKGCHPIDHINEFKPSREVEPRNPDGHELCRAGEAGRRSTAQPRRGALTW